MELNEQGHDHQRGNRWNRVTRMVSGEKVPIKFVDYRRLSAKLGFVVGIT